MRKFCVEIKKDWSIYNYASDTKHDKISKFISIETNTGLDSAKNYCMRFDINEYLCIAYDTTAKSMSVPIF